MSTLRATVVDLSIIRRHKSIPVSDNLTTAKRQAARAFGNGFADNTIRIYDAATGKVITERRVGGGLWSV